MKILVNDRLFKKSIQDMARDNCIVRHLAGSHAYGTSTPTSDTDYRGIFTADPHYVLTPFYNVETVELSGEEDTVYHEVGKYIQLLIGQNPNIIETLWVDDSDIQFRTPEYDYLRSYREDLLSSKCMFTYSGYANSQLKRLKGHHRWLELMEAGKLQIRELFTKQLLTSEQLRNHFEGDILDSIQVPFIESVQFDKVEYDWVEVLDVLNDNKYHEARLMCNIPFMEYEFANVVIPNGGDIKKFRHSHCAIRAKGSSNVYHLHTAPGCDLYDGRGSIIDNHITDVDGNCVAIVEVNTGVKSTNQAKWTNYHDWRNNRNVSRSTLEAKHGYDTKHASHLIRLLKTGIEILYNGEVLVKRPDAQELLDIRNGSLTLTELLAYSDMLEARCKWLYSNTKLPNSVHPSLPAKILLRIRAMSFDLV